MHALHSEICGLFARNLVTPTSSFVEFFFLIFGINNTTLVIFVVFLTMIIKHTQVMRLDILH